MVAEQSLGYWWVPGSESGSVPGLLSWDRTKDQNGELTLLNVLSLDSNDDELVHVPLILGESQGHKLSLLGCTVLPRVDRDSTVQVWTVTNIVGNGHIRDNDAHFSGGTLVIDGMGIWCLREEIHSLIASQGVPESNVSIPIVNFALPNATVELAVINPDMRRRLGPLEDYDITVSIRCDPPLPFNILKREVVLPLCALVSVATATRGTVKWALFHAPNDFDQLYSVSGSWVGQTQFTPKWIQRPLFTALQLSKDVEDPLSKWVEMAKEHRSALDVFLRTSQVSRLVDPRMYCLALISCLDALIDVPKAKRIDEGLRNQLIDVVRSQSNNPFVDDIIDDLNRLTNATGSNTLRSRLRASIDELSDLVPDVQLDQVDVNSMLSQIVHTRACIAHASPESCAKAADEMAMYFLSDFVLLLVNVQFLKRLGFSNQTIAGLIKDSYYFGSHTYIERFRERAG